MRRPTGGSADGRARIKCAHMRRNLRRRAKARVKRTVDGQLSVLVLNLSGSRRGSRVGTLHPHDERFAGSRAGHRRPVRPEAGSLGGQDHRHVVRNVLKRISSIARGRSWCSLTHLSSIAHVLPISLSLSLSLHRRATCTSTTPSCGTMSSPSPYSRHQNADALIYASKSMTAWRTPFATSSVWDASDASA